MARRRLVSSVAVACLATGISPRARAATQDLSQTTARASPGADIFATNAPVLRIRVEVAEVDLKLLRSEPRKPVPATVREGEQVLTNATVHLKGAAGSFRQVDDKPALTLGFGRSPSDRRFHGLRKIHLNNSVQDPSYSTEYLCGAMFHAAGVPAPRVTHARVWLNGRDLGFYVLIEGFNREFLGRYFKDTTGNLYDGGFLKDVSDKLDRESGEGEDTQSDLKALAAAAGERDRVRRWEQLNRTLDVERFASFMALEVLTWDWDGYAMNRNNYRVYHDPATDRLVFLPHGMDQMFWEANGPIHPGFGGMVASAFSQTPEGDRLFRGRLKEVFERVYRLEVLTNTVDRLHRRNGPAVAELGEDAARDYDQAVSVVRDRIVQRWHGVREQLENDPGPLTFRNGVARPGPWRPQGDAGLNRVEEGGKALLHIAANGDCTASWRTRVVLEGGRYRLEGLARGAGIAPLKGDSKGAGAGLRISGTTAPRANHLAGDSPWTKLEFEFEVAPSGNEVELVCELRATRGEAWFDADSLKLARLDLEETPRRPGRR